MPAVTSPSTVAILTRSSMTGSNGGKRTTRDAPRKSKQQSRPAAMRAAQAKLDHLGIAVRSLDHALKFYQEQLGLSVWVRETVAHEKVNEAMLPVGEPRIELLEPAEADSVIGKFLEKRGEGGQIGRAHVELQSRSGISYPGFGLK